MKNRRRAQGLACALVGLGLTQCGPSGAMDSADSGGGALGGAGGASTGGAASGGTGTAAGGSTHTGGAEQVGGSASDGGGLTGGFGGESGLAGSTSGGAGGESTGTGGGTQLLGQGEACSSASACESDHCVDGVCCESVCDDACVACVSAETGDRDGTCAPIQDGSVCREEAGPCDLEEVCSDGTCPDDTFATSAAECAPYACTGVSAQCGASCLTSADCAGDARSVCLGDACTVGKLVFVSSETYTGDLGGVSGAHQKCQALAEAAGLSGTYLAWINGGTASILDSHAQSTGPYVRVGDKAIIANHWTALTGGSLSNAINRTETGTVIGNEYAWTNSNAQGGTRTNHCSDWTSTSGSGSAGFVAASTSQWTDAGTMPCNFGLYHLYCFEQ